MKIARWGNSLAVRIPGDVARQLGLGLGDDVEFERTADGKLALKRRGEAVRQLRRFRGLLPNGGFNREAANGR